MKYLLDTSVAFRNVAEPQRLNSATAALAEPSSILYISSASVFEMAIKYATAICDSMFISELADELKSGPLAISHRHAVEAGGLPRHHDHLSDRMLVAPARGEGLVLLSADRMMKNYEVELLLCCR